MTEQTVTVPQGVETTFTLNPGGIELASAAGSVRRERVDLSTDPDTWDDPLGSIEFTDNGDGTWTGTISADTASSMPIGTWWADAVLVRADAEPDIRTPGFRVQVTPVSHIVESS